jgi:hypothetical protein
MLYDMKCFCMLACFNTMLIYNILTNDAYIISF